MFFQFSSTWDVRRHNGDIENHRIQAVELLNLYFLYNDLSLLNGGFKSRHCYFFRVINSNASNMPSAPGLMPTGER